MKRYLRWIVAAEFLFAAGNLHAVEVEVPGLLTDHTVSSIGHDFYRAFSDKWESDYTGNLTINERPSARWVRIPLYSITDWHRSPISDSHPF
ncbi:CsgE family curli-type amyloid fiber assembly protein, partial [Escherichia coli]|uniref:CsgE family curli-type amyloid fiber assembly protein n=1 Tax=Escherichia coli TaxID=562 RepID=UPI002FE29868